MIRRVPLVTRTPLRRHQPLHTRVAGLRPQRRRHAASGTPARREDLSPAQRDILYIRFEGRCESGLSPHCWVRLPAKGWHAAHRINRARGGNNTELWQRYASCAPCNYWQEDHPAEAAETGHYVRSGLDPRRTPMCLPDGRIVLLDAEGGYLPAVLGGDAA